MNLSTEALECWQQALQNARRRAPASFEQWFSSVQFGGLNNGVLELTARDEFVREWVSSHFLPAIVADLESTQAGGQGSVRVQWTVSSKICSPVGSLLEETNHLPEPTPGKRSRMNDSKVAAPVVSSTQKRDSREPATRQNSAAVALRAVPDRVGDPINPKHTFPNFVVGPSNELAYAAAVASSGSEGPRYNPLFICGGTGLGKTHLAHSIAHALLGQEPNSRILYVSAERFTNEFIEALQHHRMEEFRARYRRHCDALLVDDIQFLAGREQTQEEFFHTFNALRDADKPIVVTSDKYPQELQRMPERLISRFTSGLVADVQTPALETRVAIIQKKAALEGITLEEGVAVLLAQSIKSNVRELEGTLIRLAAKSSLLGVRIDFNFTQGELSLVKPLRIEPSSVQDIQRAVCGHFSLSNAELLSKDRHKSVAFARQVAMYLCRLRLKCSFPELGRAFGNRDHTTVMSACRRVESLRHRNPEVNAHLQAIENQLTSSG